MPRIIQVDPENPRADAMDFAAAAVRSGKIVVYPTDTVYGLGADPFNERAVIRLFEVKNRPRSRPLPVAVSGQNMVDRIAFMTEKAQKLMERFWPGALTVVLAKKAGRLDALAGGGDSIGVRAPNHPVPLALLSRTALPLVATSANLHGELPSRDARGAVSQLRLPVDLVLDGGETTGIASTVVDLTTTPPVIMREGPIPKALIERQIGKVVSRDFRSHP
jgi:L-threonylcarbamoyladenylate synthase